MVANLSKASSDFHSLSSSDSFYKVEIVIGASLHADVHANWRAGGGPILFVQNQEFKFTCGDLHQVSNDHSRGVQSS